MHRWLVVIGLLLLASALWPAIALVNRVEPFLLGLPPFVLAMFLVNVLVVALLAVAYWKANP